MTDLLCLDDAYLTEFEAVVTAVDGRRIALDRTAFYPTGGGQPHDTGTIGNLGVVDVVKEGDEVWHELADGEEPPAPGTPVRGAVDWDRRYGNMRTHTALHCLCGVIWNLYRVPVTGGNMEPLSARMDFEFDPVPPEFRTSIEEAVNRELRADRPVVVGYIPRAEAVLDEELIRTKVSLVPASVEQIRVVEIVGLDKQADGGTHVARTGEVGRVEVRKVESKGKGFKRVRLAVVDA